MARTPTIIVHDRVQADAALSAAGSAGVAIVLMSPPGAGATLGPGVFKAMTDEAMAAYPETTAAAVLDCAAEAGIALAAIRHGCPHIAIDLPKDVAAKIEDMAAQSRTVVHVPSAGAVLDLGAGPEPEHRAQVFLNRELAHV